jgi:hypothetical protein
MANAWLVPPLPVVSIDANSTTRGVPSHMLNDYVGVIWRGEGVGTHNIVFDLGRDVAIDTIMLFGVAVYGASPSWQISLATAAQGPSFAAGSFWAGPQEPMLVGSLTPETGSVALWSAPVGAPAAIRHVSIVIRHATAFRLDVSRLVISKRVQLERNFTFGAAHGVRDLGSIDFSARGVLIRRRAKKLRTLGLTFSNVRRDEVEGQVRPLLGQIGNTEMIALVTDPEPHAMRQRRCFFGPLVGDLGDVHRNAAAFEAKTNLVSIF